MHESLGKIRRVRKRLETEGAVTIRSIATTLNLKETKVEQVMKVGVGDGRMGGVGEGGRGTPWKSRKR